MTAVASPWIVSGFKPVVVEVCVPHGFFALRVHLAGACFAFVPPPVSFIGGALLDGFTAP